MTHPRPQAAVVPCAVDACCGDGSEDDRRNEFPSVRANCCQDGEDVVSILDEHQACIRIIAIVLQLPPLKPSVLVPVTSRTCLFVDSVEFLDDQVLPDRHGIERRARASSTRRVADQLPVSRAAPPGLEGRAGCPYTGQMSTIEPTANDQRGEFWLPATPETRIAGKLQFGPPLAGQLVLDGELMPGPGPEPLVHGLLFSGQHNTALACYAAGRNTRVTRDRKLVSQKLAVKTLIIGEDVDEHAKFDHLLIRLSHIREWANVRQGWDFPEWA
jgi:hypothetical protein